MDGELSFEGEEALLLSPAGPGARSGDFLALLLSPPVWVRGSEGHGRMRSPIQKKGF